MSFVPMGVEAGNRMPVMLEEKHLQIAPEIPKLDFEFAGPKTSRLERFQPRLDLQGLDTAVKRK